MSDKVTIFVDPTPLGRGYLLRDTQTFLARPVELPGDIAQEIVKRSREFEFIQGWLAQVYAQASRRGAEIEVPETVKDILCPEEVQKEKPPKKKATARRSSKKSQKRPAKTESDSSTSQKTE